MAKTASISKNDLCAALERSMLAIDDLTCLCANGQANEDYYGDTLARVRSRVNANGGVMAYVANVQRQNREAIGGKP